VELAVPRLGPSEIDAMRRANGRFAAALGRGDAEAAIAADDEFHSVAVRAAANDALETVLEQFTPVLRRLERLRFSSLSGRASVALHDRLTDLCEAGDTAAAAEVAHSTWETLRPLIAALEDADRAQPG
jgi:DNA-binding GntR family transcriptional regulator